MSNTSSITVAMPHSTVVEEIVLAFVDCLLNDAFTYMVGTNAIIDDISQLFTDTNDQFAQFI